MRLKRSITDKLVLGFQRPVSPRGPPRDDPGRQYPDRLIDFCCLTSTEARRPIRDGDEWEKGDRRVKPRNRRQPGRPRLPWTAARTTVSVRHCPATTAPRNCCPNCYAKQSHKDNVRSSAVGKQLKRKKSNSLSLAQHHLPPLGLFWASFFVRVQLTSLLLISSGLASS